MAIITISRQFGAGGKTLGKMIADELDYEFADSEIIEKVAEMANVSTHWVETVERKPVESCRGLFQKWFPNRWSTAS